jgi:hypothetical protein
VDEIPVPYVLDLLRRCDGPSSPAWLYARFFNFRFDLEFAGQWRHPQARPGRAGGAVRGSEGGACPGPALSAASWRSVCRVCHSQPPRCSRRRLCA